MGIMVPRDLGGEGASLSAVVDVCYRLARACASSGMIYAMHQIMVACVLRHRRGSGWHERMLRRLCAEQMLLASSTTEGRGGGNVRASEAPIEHSGNGISLERRATVISYGANADAIVTTARRAADAAASDQVLVAFLKEDYSLEPLVAWDTLGMRGTCSAGFTLKASGEAEQILPDPYEKIHVQTMVPVAHLAWASVWAGVASGAVERAQFFIRSVARQAGGQLPPGACPLHEGEILAGDAARVGGFVSPEFRAGGARRAEARLSRLPDHDQPDQGRGIGTGGFDRVERAQGMRPFRLSE